MPARRVDRVDRAGAADLTGRTEATIARYERLRATQGSHPFPAPDSAGKYSVDELKAYVATAKRGSAAGVAKPRSTYPCQRCGTLVPRRWKDAVTGELLCKPDLIAADAERKAAE